MKLSVLKKVCFMAILGISPLAIHAENLLEVYQQALHNDPTFKEAEATWMAAKENVPIAAANLLPALNVSGSVNRVYSNIGGVSNYSNGSDYSLTVGQPIINFAYLANLRGTKDSTKAAAATYAAAAQNLMYRTVQAYISVMQADDNLHFTLAQKRAIKEELINAKQKYEAGITAITGVYQAQASYDAIVATEIANRTTLATNLENLKAITGQDYYTLNGILQQVPLATPEPSNMQAWIEVARQQNPQIKAQAYTVMAARENIKQQQAGFIPTLTANGSYNFSSASQLEGAQTTKGASIGASLNFPVYSGGATLAETRQARYNYVNASAALEYTYRSTVNQTSQAYLTIISMISQIKADIIAVKSAEASFKSTQLGYVAGTQPMLNVLEDLSNVYQARQQYDSDQYAYLLAIVSLKQAAGTLGLSDLVAINNWLGKSQAVAADSAQSLIEASMPQIKKSSVTQTSVIKTKAPVATTASTNANYNQGTVHYTFQVAALTSQSEAEQFVKQHPNDSLQIFTRPIQGKTWFSVGYGNYASIIEAKNNLKNLPTDLLALKPWIAQVNPL